MIPKILVLLFLAAVVSSNPAAEQEWHWIPRALTVNPQSKHLPIPKNVVKPKVHEPRPKPERVFVENCGTTPAVGRIHHDAKIVGGQEATPHAYPWQVGIFIDDMYFCGGSLISSEWVLTAGHCLYESKSAQVVLGAHNIREAEVTQVSITSTDLIVHEDYSPTLVHNDIALIHLPQAVEFTDYIQPVCLPTGESDLDEGTSVTPTGWGKTHDGIGTISDTLNEVTVQTVTDEVCADYYGSLTINGDQICIDATDGHGTCNGDSGGPLNYNTVGGWQTRGITSFGSSAGCESGAPDAFTQVTHFLDWIEAKTGVTNSKKRS
ncbi:UNVERIFIED_CONTAM: hypothetical protein RMT77_006554 [Armadillidium vulgare]